MPTANAGNLELALAASMRELLDALSPNIANETQTATAQETLLPYLAQASAVPYWNSALTSDEKRELIQGAPAFYDLAGTAKAIDKALSLLGFEYTLTPWYEDAAEPYTAKLSIRVDRDLGRETDDALNRLLTRLIALRDAITIELIIQPRVDRQFVAVLTLAERLTFTPTL